MSECKYCGGDCSNQEEYMCDGYSGDIDNLYGEKMSKIKDTDLNVDRLENLAKLVVDSWDMDTLVQFAQEQVFQNYQYDIDQAARDANDLDIKLEELND